MTHAAGDSDYGQLLADAAAALEQARSHRDELIVEASASGMSRRAVAAAVGMTAAGVQHILRNHQERRGETSDS
jgi:hypothetical protein